MVNLSLNNCIALLMICVMLSISMFGNCNGAHGSAEASWAQASESCAAAVASDAGHCPSCPADDHAAPGQCDSACYCDCHAPLKASPFQLVCNQLFSQLSFSESSKAIPEVFLSKFVPPQNLA